MSELDEDGRISVPPPPLILTTDTTAEGELIASALRARGFLVRDTPLARLEARVVADAPHVVILDADEPGAQEAAARLAERRDAGGAVVLCIGDPECFSDDVSRRSIGRRFERPVDFDALLAEIALVADPSSHDVPRVSLPPGTLRLQGHAAPADVEGQGPPSIFPSSGDSISAPRLLPADLSPELERLLISAEQRLAEQVAPPSVRASVHEDDDDIVLTAEQLAGLDEPLEAEDEAQSTGSGMHAPSSRLLGMPSSPLSQQGGLTVGARPGGGAHVELPEPPESRDATSTRDPFRGEPPSRWLTAPAEPPRGVIRTPAPPTPHAPSSAATQDEAPRTPFSARAETERGSPRGEPDRALAPMEPQRALPWMEPERASARLDRERASAGLDLERTSARLDLERSSTRLEAVARVEAERASTRMDPERASAPPVAERGSRPPAATPESRRRDLEAVASQAASPPDFQEILREGGAVEALARCIAARTSGSLAFGTDRGVRRVVLHDGDIVTAASTLDDETLLSFLAARGDLERDTTARLLGKVPAVGRHAGAALIALGHLAQDDLWPVLRAHAEWIIGRALVEVSGTCALEADPPGRLRAEPSVFGGATGAEVFVETVRRVVPVEAATARLGGRLATFVEGRHAALLGECALVAAEEQVVRAAAGRTADEVLAGAEPELASVLYALAALGVLESFARPEAEARGQAQAPDPLDEEALRARVRARMALVEEGDYFALLGVPRLATGYEIRRAYAELRRAFEPARALTAATADLEGDMRLIVEVLDEAYDILREPHRRERYRRAIETGPPG